MSALTKLLTTNQIFSNLIPQIARENLFNNTRFSISTCSSSIINNAVRATVGSWWYYELNTLSGVIAHLYSKILGKSLTSVAFYDTITEGDTVIEDADGLARRLQLNRVYTEDVLAINYVYIPKGKTFLKQILDKCTDLEEIKWLETRCIQSKWHFFKVYKNFPLGTRNITILTDNINADITTEIFVQLAHILDIKPIEEPITQEAKEKNLFINYLHTLLEKIYPYQGKEEEVLTEETAQQLISEIKALTKTLLDNFDFVTGNLTNFITNMQNMHTEGLKNQIKKQIQETKNSIESHEQYLEEAYNKFYALNRQLITQNNMNPEDMSEFTELLTNSSAIEILATNPKQITIRVTAPFKYFDGENVKTYEDNPNSYLNDLYKNHSVEKAILHKIFVTKEYKLLTQAVITLRIEDYYTPARIQLNAERDNFDNLTEFPNPHLCHYNCWDEAKNQINKALASGNYGLILPQIIAAVQSVNTAESASFVHRFLEDFINPEFQERIHIQTSDGQIHALKEIKEIEIKQQLEKTPQYNAKEYTQIEIPDDDENWEE